MLVRKRGMTPPRHRRYRKVAATTAGERDDALFREEQRRAQDEAYFSECITCCEPAPKVILAPCEHKIMCRRCADRVQCCPVCPRRRMNTCT